MSILSKEEEVQYLAGCKRAEALGLPMVSREVWLEIRKSFNDLISAVDKANLEQEYLDDEVELAVGDYVMDRVTQIKGTITSICESIGSTSAKVEWSVDGTGHSGCYEIERLEKTNS